MTFINVLNLKLDLLLMKDNKKTLCKLIRNPSVVL